MQDLQASKEREAQAPSPTDCTAKMKSAGAAQKPSTQNVLVCWCHLQSTLNAQNLLGTWWCNFMCVLAAIVGYNEYNIHI
jgi:hypothetical protein